MQRHVAVFFALTTLDAQVADVGLNRADGLLAALPGGANLIQIRLRDVLQGAQLLVAIKGHFVVTRGQHGGFQAGLRGSDLRIQLFVGQACLLERDLRRFYLIAKRRVVEFKQQIASLHLAVVMDMYRRHVAGDARRHRRHYAHHGGVRRQRDPDIRDDKVDKHQQERGNTHPYPAGKLLFRGHYFSVLLSSSRIVRKLQAIWFNVALKMSRCSGAMFCDTRV